MQSFTAALYSGIIILLGAKFLPGTASSSGAPTPHGGLRASGAFYYAAPSWYRWILEHRPISFSASSGTRESGSSCATASRWYFLAHHHRWSSMISKMQWLPLLALCKLMWTQVTHLLEARSPRFSTHLARRASRVAS